MPGARYEAVLFDFGGVFTQSPFEAVRLHGDELGADPELVLSVLFGDYDQDGNHPWHRLERGEIALPAARAEINELATTARGLISIRSARSPSSAPVATWPMPWSNAPGS